MADGTVVIDTRLNTKGAEAGVSKLKGTLIGIGSTAGKVASGGLKLATNALKAGTVAATGLVGAAIKVGSSFDSSMSKVKAISGASATEFDKLREKAIEMGDKTKFSATEAADAFQYMAMAGWKTGDMMSGIEGIMNLAAASGEDLATTSDIVTDALTAFGLKAADSGHFADILAVASSNANTNVGMMGETFKYVAPVAGSLGYSAEDTALAIGLMANSGIKASQAGTSLRSIMTRLSTDAGASKNTLGALGTLTEKLGVQFYDSAGKARPLNDVLMESREAWKGLTDEQQVNYAKQIAGQEGVSAWMAIMNASSADVDKLTGSLQNCDGAAENMANTMNDNLEGAFTILQSNLSTLGIRVYDSLKDSLKGGVELGQNYVKSLTEGFEQGGAQGLITVLSSEIIPDMIKRATEALPGMLQVGLDMMTNIMAGIRQNIPALEPAVNEIITALSTGLTTYFTEFFAMGADIVIMICNGISQNSGQIGTEAANAATGIVTSIVSVLPSVLQAGVQLVVSLANGIASNAGQIINAINTALNQMVDYIVSNSGMIIDAAFNLVDSLATGLIQGLPQILSAALTLLSGIVQAIPQVVTNLLQEIPKLINSLVNTFSDSKNQKMLFDKALELLKNIVTAIGQIVISLGKEAPKIVTAIINAIQKLPGMLWNLLQLAIQKVKSWVTSFTSEGGKGGKSFLDKVIDFISKLPGKIFDFLMKAIPKVASWGTKFIGKVPGIVGGFITKFVDFLGKLPAKMLYALSFVITKLVSWGVKFATKAPGMVKDFIDKFIKKLQELPGKIPELLDKIKEKFQKLADDLPEIGKNIVKGLWNGIVGLKDWVIDKVKGMGEAILDGIKDALGIHSPSKRAEKEVGAQIVNGIVNGISKNQDKAVKSAKEMATAVLNEAKEVTGAQNWFEKQTMNIGQAVQYWENVVAKFKKGTNEYIEAQKYLGEAQRQLAEQQGEIITEYNQEQRAIVEQTKQSLDELAATTKQKIDEIQKVYDDAVKAREDSLYKSMNLFEEFTSTTEQTSESLLSNLQSQVDGLTAYNNTMDSLAKRNIPQELLEELQNMGPEHSAELGLINSMTDEQLSEYVALWEEKKKLAHEQAVKENEQLRIDTEAQIDVIQKESEESMRKIIEQSDKDMEELRRTYVRKLEDIGVSVTAESKSNGSSLMDGFKQGIDNKKSSILSYVQSVFAEIAATARAELDIHSPSRVFRKIGQQSMEGYALGWEDVDMTEQVKSTFKNGINTLKDISLSATISQANVPQTSSAPVLNFYDTQTSPDAIYQKFYQQQTYGLAREF